MLICGASFAADCPPAESRTPGPGRADWTVGSIGDRCQRMRSPLERMIVRGATADEQPDPLDDLVRLGYTAARDAGIRPVLPDVAPGWMQAY